MKIYGLKSLVDQEILGVDRKAGEILKVDMDEEKLRNLLPTRIATVNPKPKPTLDVVEMEATEKV